MGMPGSGSKGQGELGPPALVSRTKPARAGPGYSQQEAHVGRGVGWGARRSLGLGAAAAAAVPAAAREEEGRRKEEEERRRKGSAGCSTATTCSAFLVPMAG